MLRCLWREQLLCARLSKNWGLIRSSYSSSSISSSKKVDSVPFYSSGKAFEFLVDGSTGNNQSQQSLVNENKLQFFTGKMGQLSESTVLCRQGGTVVHCAINSTRAAAATAEDFLPLTVDYRARHYAFGKIPNTSQSTRRERHGTDEEVLVARCIDRAIRPMFPKGYIQEVQLTVTCHAADGTHDPAIAAVNAASFALLQSKQPWSGPIACVRVGEINGKLIVNPPVHLMAHSTLDLVYAGTKGRAVMMEAIAHQVSDKLLNDATALADIAISELIDAQLQLIAMTETDTGSDKRYKRFAIVPDEVDELVKSFGWEKAAQLYRNEIHLDAAGEAAVEVVAAKKEDRSRAEGKLRYDIMNGLNTSESELWMQQPPLVKNMAVDAVMHRAFRKALLDCSNNNNSNGSYSTLRRTDGRALSELRNIQCAADVLPIVHGSAYFVRGDTHVLGTVTLAPKDQARAFTPIDGTVKPPAVAVATLTTGNVTTASSNEILQHQQFEWRDDQKLQHFMLHYDFPPYATGETGNATATNRRMIGHGNLAEKALLPVMPRFGEFPYAVRVFAECTSSNGSSSMASACAASLALLDAGVPIKAPVAGVSVGLVTAAATTTDGDVSPPVYALLKDILGSEDHHGDMDFKVAGTKRGVTAIQLDAKLAQGIPLNIIKEALHIAQEGRLEILVCMDQCMPTVRAAVKEQAPKAELVRFDPDRTRLLVGPGGEMLKYMEELFSVVINTEQEGLAYIYGMDARKTAACRMLVQDIAILVKEGDTVCATVHSLMDFGLIVKINRAQEALLHISDLSHDANLLKTPLHELLQPGQRINVMVTAVDKTTGLVKVSRKALLDRKGSLPDSIQPIVGSNLDTDASFDALAAGDELPTFPTVPPKRFDRDFFRLNVATDDEIQRALSSVLGDDTDQRRKPRDARNNRRSDDGSNNGSSNNSRNRSRSSRGERGTRSGNGQNSDEKIIKNEEDYSNTSERNHQRSDTSSRGSRNSSDSRDNRGERRGRSGSGNRGNRDYNRNRGSSSSGDNSSGSIDSGGKSDTSDTKEHSNSHNSRGRRGGDNRRSSESNRSNDGVAADV